MAQVNQAQNDVERAQEKQLQAEEAAARQAWLVPLLWVAGISLALVAFVKVAPPAASAPVKKVFHSTFGVVFEVAAEVVLWVYYGIRVILLYGLFGFSVLAVGAGAAEQGTSWWWDVACFAGFVMMVKADDDNRARTELIAIALFAIATIGVFVQMWANG